MEGPEASGLVLLDDYGQDGGGALLLGKRTWDDFTLAPPEPEVGRGPVLRCLDPTHGPDCQNCTQAPPVSQENSFELTGCGCTSKEGEKVCTRWEAPAPEGPARRWP